MTRTILLLCACKGLLIDNASAQIVFDHGFTIGGGYADLGYALASDNQGNIYCSGNFQYLIDIDPSATTHNLTSVGGDDAYLIKYSPTGALLWGLNIGSTGNENGRRIALDESGNIYQIGMFEGTADFDPGSAVHALTSAGSSDVYVAKYDPNGNYVWAVSLGGADADYGVGLTIDNPITGHIIICGSYTSTSIDLDPGSGTQMATNAGGGDVFVVALNTSGVFQSGFTFGGISNEQANVVSTDGSGNIYVGGEVGTDSVDFDPDVNATFLVGLPGSGLDLFVAKYTSSGAFTWARRISGPWGETCSGIAANSAGDVYFTGYFNSPSVDFDPGPNTLLFQSQGSQDMYLEKLNSSGDMQWAFPVGDYWSDSGYDVKLDNAGRVVVCGGYGDTVDFDPGAAVHQIIEQGQGDAFVAVYDAGGNYLDAFGVGGTDNDAAWGLALTAPDKVSITGFYFSPSVDLDPGSGTHLLTNLGGADSYLATYHYLSNGVEENAATEHLRIAPNPASGHFTLLANASDVQRIELVNALGAEVPVTVISRSNDRIELDASSCASGIYLLRVITSDGGITERVVLE